MECKCGGAAEFKQHEIQNAETVFEWAGIRMKQEQMPVFIGRNVCDSCGRQSAPTIRLIKKGK